MENKLNKGKNTKPRKVTRKLKNYGKLNLTPRGATGTLVA